MSRKIQVQKRAYTVPEAMEAFGIGESMLREAIREGRLPARLWGSHLRIPADDMEAFFNRLPLAYPLHPDVEAQRANPA